MTFFTPAEVAELRALQESTFADTCLLSDPRHKTSAQGQEWIERGVFPCGVSSLSQAIQTGQITYVPDMPANAIARVFALPVSAGPIEPGARVCWTGDTNSEHFYEVRTVELPGSYPMQVSVVAVRTRSAA